MVTRAVADKRVVETAGSCTGIVLVRVVAAAGSNCAAIQRFDSTGNDAVGSFVRSFLNPDRVRRVMLVFGLIDGYLGLILVFAAMQLPLALWIMKTYFDTIPHDYEEAALVDGATLFQRIRHVIAPLALPGLGAAGIFAFISAWGDFLMPLILLSSSELQMLPLGLFRAFLRVHVTGDDCSAVASGFSARLGSVVDFPQWQAHTMNYFKRTSWQVQLLLLPCVLLIGALVVYPAIYSIYLSLTNASLVGAAATNPRFVGMRNYMRLFADGGFWNSLVVTFWFVLGSAVIGQFVLGLVSAVLLCRPLRFKNLFNSIILLPNAVPEVVAGYLWISMLAGGGHSTLNRLLGCLGIPSVRWLEQFPLAMIIVANTWRGIASAMILMMAGLSSVPPEIYEAARIDGASPRQIFRSITLPLIMPNIFLYMLVSTVTTISIFGFIYALTRGGPGNATEIIGIYIYNQSFTAFQLGYGSAVAVVTLAISMAIGLVYVRVLRVKV